MSPPPARSVVLRHGTTLDRARKIVANGPDPYFREPGSGQTPPDLAFSTSYPDSDGYRNGTGEAGDQAVKKARNFPEEGGPAVLEIAVPEWIVQIVLSDPISRGTALGGEVRFELVDEEGTPHGLEELVTAWPDIPKRVYTPADPEWGAVTRWASSR